MNRFGIIDLFLTEQCNLNCEYCNFSSTNLDNPVNPKSVNMELLQKYLPVLAEWDNVGRFTVTGGEPGLVSADAWDYIFSTVKRTPLKINTNGLFIQNGYLHKYFDQIMHVGFHPEGKYLHEYPDFLKDVPCEKIRVYLPFGKMNYKDIPRIAELYGSHEMNLIPMEPKVNLNDFENSQNFMQPEDYQKVQSSIHEINNINGNDKWIIGLLGNPKTNLRIFQKGCCGGYVHPFINFVTGAIHRCPVNYNENDRVPLTMENLEKLKNYQIFDDFGTDYIDPVCAKCPESIRYCKDYMKVLMNKKFKGAPWK